MKIIFSPKCLGYSSWLHPEKPERIEQAYDFLKDKYEFLEPKPASKEDLLKVHTSSYVEEFERGRFRGDGDTPAYRNIYEYAKLSAGGAILAAKEKGFSLMRPPGHHAGRNGIALGAPSLGFCYFNNIAIATRSLGLTTLIVDIDGHHGNGTQEIFLGDGEVTFISLHRRGIYPRTGWKSELNCFNFPLAHGTGDSKYLETLDKALAQVDLKGIEVIGISAGFDAHEGDLSSLGLSSECYKEIGKRIAALGKPVFAVLEGGYGNHLGPDIHNLIKGLKDT